MQKSKKKFLKRLFSVLFLFCCIQVTVPMLVGCNEAQQPAEKFTEEIKLDIEQKIKATIDDMLGFDEGSSYQIVCTYTDVEMVLSVDLQEFFPYINQDVKKEINKMLERDYPNFVFQEPEIEGTTLIYTII